MKRYICFDVGGTKVKYGLLLEDGSILSKGNYNTRQINLELFLKDMIDTINMYTRNTIVSGIAISLPGFINPHTGYSEAAGSVGVLSNQNLKKLLEAKIPLPIEIENDGNCAALAEKISGNAKNCTDFICITLGTGIGGGIFTNGKLLRGHSFKSGEFGFMVTRGKSGRFEVWHSNASTSALIHSYKKLKGLSENENIDGETVFLDYNNDHSVRKLIDNWTKNISYGIFNLSVALNPQKVLIGGGVANQQELLSMINHQLDLFPWWKVFKVPVELCKHQNDAGIIGALYHFLQEQT